MFTQLNNITRSCITALIVCSVLGVGHAAQAQKPQAQKPAATPAPGSDKLDVTDLEKKYWASKDTDFSVVQNRTYSKANRFALSAQYGTLINDQYSDGNSLSTSLSYYFSERHGMELTYSSIDSKDNKSVEAFKSQNGATPDHNKIMGYYGASYNWVPFYAKMSFLSSKILYFDMAISPGLGVTSYEAQVETGNVKKTAPTASLDVTQMFFLGKHFAVRVDYKNRWFNQQVLKASGSFSGPGPAGSELRKDLNHTSLLMFGAEFFF